MLPIEILAPRLIRKPRAHAGDQVEYFVLLEKALVIRENILLQLTPLTEPGFPQNIRKIGPDKNQQLFGEAVHDVMRERW